MAGRPNKSFKFVMYMEAVSVILAGLLFSGYILNKGNKQRQNDNTISSVKFKRDEGDNVYTHNTYTGARKEEFAKEHEKFVDAQNPNSTIVPQYANELNSDLYNKGVIYAQNPTYNGNKQIDYAKLLEQSYGKKFSDEDLKKMMGTNNNLSILGIKTGNADGQTGMTAVDSNVSDQTTNAQNLTPFYSPSQNTLSEASYSVENLPSIENDNALPKDMTHNNMIPFSRMHNSGLPIIDNRLSEGRLETFTGQFKNNHPQKDVVEPLFNPSTNATNIYAKTSSYNNNPNEDRDLTRFNPNNIGKKNNETPFEIIHVGPGLADGYTARPSGGFHNPVRILPRTIDDLLVNPKVVRKGRIVPGKGLTQNRTAMQLVYKNRPKVLVTNEHGERNFTTTGQSKGRTLRPTVVFNTTARVSSCAPNIGPCAPVQHHRRQVDPQVKISTRQNFVGTPYRNAFQHTHTRLNDFGKGGVENKPNERDITQSRKHLLNPITDVKRQRVYDPRDITKKTRKQSYIYGVRQAGNVSNPINKRQIVYDPKDVARTTIKETTPVENYVGGMSPMDAEAPQNYEYAYNMRQNLNKEVVSALPPRTPVNVPLPAGVDKVYFTTHKRDSDRKNQYSGIKGSNMGDRFFPTGTNIGTITTYPNKTSYFDPRLKSFVVEQFNRNPLTQSLHSY